MSISDYEEAFDEYEGTSLDPWEPPSSRAPGWPEDELWDDPVPDEEFETLLEYAADLAESLTIDRVESIDAERLDRMAISNGSFVDKDQTRYEGSAPYRRVVVSLDQSDHVYVVTRSSSDGAGTITWVVRTTEDRDVEPTLTETPGTAEPAPAPEVLTESSAFTVKVLGTRTESVRTLSGEDHDAEVTLYKYYDHTGNVVDFGLFQADNGEAWLHTTNVESSMPVLGRLRRGGRMGIRGDGATSTAELTHLRITNYPWSGLRMASLAELDAGCGRDVAAELLDRGALAIGTRAELEGCTSGRRNILAVRFPADDDEVPVHAYVLTRIITLVQAQLSADSS